ncbi:MAG: TIGR00730 family Rossman fold protein [Corynebacterium sp.]|nr:TIGR00730 family Rossman fold protein [Corynebacterium sp.]
MIKNIAVYCGAAEGNRPEYRADAVAVAEEIAKRGYGLVYGGGDIGLMGAVGDAAMAAGGYVHGVIPHHLADKEIAHSNLSVLERVEDMRVRKARMEQLSQAFIVLPGGSGTLEEFYEIYTMQQLYEGMGPIVLFDTLGYWQPMLRMLEHCVEEGFLMGKYVDALIVTSDINDMFRQLENWVSPGVKYE